MHEIKEFPTYIPILWLCRGVSAVASGTNSFTFFANQDENSESSEYDEEIDDGLKSRVINWMVVLVAEFFYASLFPSPYVIQTCKFC